MDFAKLAAIKKELEGCSHAELIIIAKEVSTLKSLARADEAGE